jgi:hypothetical protein
MTLIWMEVAKIFPNKMYHSTCNCIKWQLQDVPLKRQPQNSHVLLYKNKIRSRSTPCGRLSHPPSVTLESRLPLLLGHCSRQLPKTCAGANVMYSRAEGSSFSNITSHRNRFLIFVKHLATRILTRKYRIRQQYAGWKQNFRTEEVFACLWEGGAHLLCCISVSSSEQIETKTQLVCFVISMSPKFTNILVVRVPF